MNHSYGIKSICDIAPDTPFAPGDANTWPVMNHGSRPEVAQRPEWRYPSRHDFFVASRKGGRIDWKNREIDRCAVNARGDIIYVCSKMNFLQRLWYWPPFQKIKIRHKIDVLIWRIKNKFNRNESET